MNKQQLAAKIWAGANGLRGKIAAATYKDYMLGFMFYKYLSNKEIYYLKNNNYYTDEDIKTILFEPTDENDSLYKDKEQTYNLCNENLGYFISYNNLFSTWYNMRSDFSVKNVTEGLSAFNRNINKNFKKVYEGIFDTLSKGFISFGEDEGSRSKAVKKLINIINDIPMDGSEDYDVLGFVYEFLLKNFAANAGKAGEFYTPHEVSLIMSEIICNHLKDKKEISIYDPTSGSGSLLINIGKYASKYIKNPNGVKYYAQELISDTFNLTRMNLIMRDIIPSNIIVRNGDTLAGDWPFFDEENEYDPVFVDACSSNPPYSQTWTPSDVNDKRFKEYGLAPKSKADYAFLLHNLYHLKNDGIMTIVLPHGVLFRGGEEAEIRKQLIEKDNIETIIGLPANIFYGTGIPTLIMVLKKKRENSDILFIDASKGFIKDGNKARLRDRDIKKIVDTVLNRQTIEGFSRLVKKEEIVKLNEYNLNIPRYVNSNKSELTSDLYASIFGGIPNYEIDLLNNYWNEFPSLKGEIFITDNKTPYSSLKTENIKLTIENNNEIKDFKKKYEESLKELPLFLKTELIDNLENVDIKLEDNVISNKLLEISRNFKIVDFYDLYELFIEKRSEISLDLEALQSDINSFNKIEPIKSYKKNNKTKEMEEFTEREDGKIFSFDFIKDNFFKDLSDEIINLENELNGLNEGKNNLLENIDPNDKEALLKEDSEDIDSKKLKTEISKINKLLKEGKEFEEDSYEDIIIKINVINNNISKLKKILKKNSVDLNNKCRDFITNITIETGKEILYRKWILSLMDNLYKISSILINNLEKEITKLNKKYENRLIDIDNDIEKTSNELSKMLDELNANEFDSLGLKEFKKLLGGNDNE